ncbi:MAG: hypothetical protein HFG48_01185 [Bacilli bacterium]|nr:hypothetical protein [Bacilli bacterium]
MKKINLMKKQELFQGRKYLGKGKTYFEGWYFKQVGGKKGISFIPGINLEDGKEKAFIQIITNNKSYFVDYKIEEFKYNDNPFSIQVGKSIFSTNSIHVDINDIDNKLFVNGDISYFDSENIYTSCFSPNIMGPFSYLPFMECNHAVITMRNKVNGSIKINNSKFSFKNGLGYIEKDWGTSFPKKYIWCQGNKFKDSSASFMVAIATVPLKLVDIKGIICVLKFGNKEYRFATYNNVKLKKYKVGSNNLDIVLKKGRYQLSIKTKSGNSRKLLAPVEGRMSKEIFESISASVEVVLKKNGIIIFADTSFNCGLEIVE